MIKQKNYRSLNSGAGKRFFVSVGKSVYDVKCRYYNTALKIVLGEYEEYIYRCEIQMQTRKELTIRIYIKDFFDMEMFIGLWNINCGTCK